MPPSPEEKFYITTALPYVNAAPHLGHALEFVQADVIARYHKSRGEDVFFNTGTDEHGLKIYRKAVESGRDPQVYVDEYAEKFKKFCSDLEIDYTSFIRTTGPHHEKAAQEFWRRCEKDIYKGVYGVKYCVGCELEKTDSELVDDHCPIHPSLEIELIEEENYFFRFSKYQQPLLDLYEAVPDFVAPAERLKEIRNFVSAGLKDFSVSRLKSKMPWGIPVPGDEDQVIYVWFDALVNYISALGWPENEEKFKNFWGERDNPRAIQVAGKDNLRQQSAMWQAMLMSAGLPASRKILIHGFVLGDGGVKMSKSLGNVVDPIEIISEFGAEALRYWLIREMPTFEDGAFSLERFKESYNANLANGLGNFAARVLALGGKFKSISPADTETAVSGKIKKAEVAIRQKFAEFDIRGAIDEIWNLIAFGDGYINETKPWEGEKKKTISSLVVLLERISELLAPFLPETSAKIKKCFSEDGRGNLIVSRGPALFPRI
ncbi:MAG TPA: methionine--tRNA ligase [Candidatus Tyrphobacter sp.]|nr:methionine--tRNA ligase [Candidatus Tyrphobacter sp.]